VAKKIEAKIEPKASPKSAKRKAPRGKARKPKPAPKTYHRRKPTGVPFVSTETQRSMASLLASEGYAKLAIARALHIDVKTLNKHFEDEMENGRALLVTKGYKRLLADVDDLQSRGGTRAAMFLVTRHGRQPDPKASASARVSFGKPGVEGEIAAPYGSFNGIPLNKNGEIEISLDIGDARPRDDIVGDTDDDDP
jgi:hypothetical protein